MRITRENNLRNHRFRLFLLTGKIALDNSWARTYHNESLYKGLTSNAGKIHVGNRVNRGVCSHDE